jgi:hypothetical protein
MAEPALPVLAGRERTPPPNILLAGVVGSTAYGLAHAGSDTDRLGCYATQQFKRIENRGDGSFPADTRRRTAKHARHLWRLLNQGTSLRQTGRLTVRLAPQAAAECRAFGEQIAAGDLGLARKVLADAEALFDRPGVLPGRPDEKRPPSIGSATFAPSTGQSARGTAANSTAG